MQRGSPPQERRVLELQAISYWLSAHSFEGLGARGLKACMETVSVEVGEIGHGSHTLPLDGLDSRLRGNDGSAAGFALLYLPYNSYQAGSKPASAGMTEHGACRGAKPLCVLPSPKVVDPPQEEWGTYRAESESPDCE